MKFSSKELYGLRAMVELARRYPEGPISLAEIAKAQGLSLPYLEQIAAVLRRAGLLKSIRGAYGGYILARAPDTITAGDVIRALEGKLIVLPCQPEKVCMLLSEQTCVCQRGPVCPTKDVWQQVHAQLARTLDRITLADLAASGR